MVTQIAEGTAFDKHGRPFRRRNVRPAVYVLVVLVAAAGAVWGIALSRPQNVHEVAVCNPPPEPAGPGQPALGKQVSRTEMTSVAPSRLAEIKIRVLNASGRAGQAAEAADALRDVGFAQPTAANDPIYASTRLDCQGQIRFGSVGQAGAAALWLVTPCAELFEDDRTDDSVDLALGTDYAGLVHNEDIETVLAGLRPDATEPSDFALLPKIHAGVC